MTVVSKLLDMAKNSGAQKPASQPPLFKDTQSTQPAAKTPVAPTVKPPVRSSTPAIDFTKKTLKNIPGKKPAYSLYGTLMEAQKKIDMKNKIETRKIVEKLNIKPPEAQLSTARPGAEATTRRMKNTGLKGLWRQLQLESPLMKKGQVVNVEKGTVIPFDTTGLDILFDIPRMLAGGIEETTGVNIAEEAFPYLKEHDYSGEVETKKPIKGTAFVKDVEKLPFWKKALYGATSRSELAGGENPYYSQDPEVNYAAEIAFPFLFQEGIGVMRSLGLGDEAFKYLTTKKEFIPPKDMRNAVNQLTSGKNVGASEVALTEAQRLINLNEKGTKVFDAVREGATVRTKRDLLKWFKEWGKVKQDPTEEVAALIDEIGAINVETATTKELDTYFNRVDSYFKEQRLAGLKKGNEVPGVEKPAPLSVVEEAKPKPIEEVPGFNNFTNLAETKIKDIPVEKSKMAELTNEKGETRPAIRKSGFYAEKGIDTAPVADVYNATLSPYHMALKQDKHKRGGEFGEIFKKVWLPTENAIKNDVQYVRNEAAEIRAIGKRHNVKPSKKNLEHISDVMEGKVDGTPAEQAHVKELRVKLDDMRKQANEVREAMGKPTIGYIKDYVPHLQKTTLWNELIDNKATISDNFDFIIPNQKKNPFSYKRMMDELPNAERNIYKLLDRYVAAISKDIHITPAIENIKAYNGVLKNRELFSASKYWDEYIRTGLVGKQHKLDSALGMGPGARKASQKWNDMVNKAFLTGKIAWNIATQPLSYIMNTPFEVGPVNAAKALYQSFSTPLREFVKENSKVLNIKNSDVNAVAVGEGRNIQNRIFRTKIDKWNDFISVISSVIERELTLASYIGGLEKAKDLGYKGEDALAFADLAAARTQSMYNKQNRALILNSDILRTAFPFQSFSVEMFNHAKEILTKTKGAERLDVRQRVGKAIYLMVGIYLSGMYAQTLTGRKKTSVGTFIPFVGAYVDKLVALGMGDSYASSREPITTLQIGEDAIKGLKDYIEHGDTKKLRKFAVNWGLAGLGAGGGAQINNIIDGIMMNIEGDVKNVEGEVLFSTQGATDKVVAPIFGVWSTHEGREYWEGDESDERIFSEEEKSKLKEEIREDVKNEYLTPEEGMKKAKEFSRNQEKVVESDKIIEKLKVKDLTKKQINAGLEKMNEDGVITQVQMKYIKRKL